MVQHDFGQPQSICLIEGIILNYELIYVNCMMLLLNAFYILLHMYK